MEERLASLGSMSADEIAKEIISFGLFIERVGQRPDARDTFVCALRNGRTTNALRSHAWTTGHGRTIREALFSAFIKSGVSGLTRDQAHHIWRNAVLREQLAEALEALRAAFDRWQT